MSGSLAGKYVVNTRARRQAAELDAMLRSRGAVPLSYPCIDIFPAEDTRALDDAIDGLIAGAFDWWVISSANTVTVVADRLAAFNRRMPTPPPFQTAAVGPGTADALFCELGLHPDMIPATFRREDLAAAVPITPGDRALILQSEIAPLTVANALAERGAIVTCVVAYRTIVGRGGISLSRLLVKGEVDAVTFASSSAVDGCATRLAEEGGQMELLNRITTVCIGPGTAKTARANGVAAPVIPVEQTLSGLLTALETALSITKEGTTS